MGLLDQGQGAATPRLAEAAAQAGAPPIGADAGAEAPPGAMPPGAPPPGAMPPGAMPPGAPPPGAMPPGAGAPPPPGAMPPGAMPPGAGAPPAPGAGGSMLPEKQGTPEEQQEYERAMRAVVRVLYGSDETARGIVDQIDPNDIVGSTAKVSMIFIKELDRKINMHESVVASVTEEAVTRIAELAEARHRVEYKGTDMEKILGATWEAVQSMFGSDPQQYSQIVQSLPPETLQAVKQQHDRILASGKQQG